MKKITLALTLMVIGVNSFAQKRTVGAYYYLEHPSSDIFSESYGGKPDGNSDPKGVVSDANITDDDLIIKKVP